MESVFSYGSNEAALLIVIDGFGSVLICCWKDSISANTVFLLFEFVFARTSRMTERMGVERVRRIIADIWISTEVRWCRR